MSVKLIVTTVESVEPWGEKLSLIKVVGIDKTVVANRHDDGSFRWTVGEPVVYVPENTILPEDVLKERGYWEDGAKKGMLGGSKGNRVKNRTFGKTETDPGVESSGLLFKVKRRDPKWDPENDMFFVTKPMDIQQVALGDDVAEFFGATEYVPE